ncbi:MAG: YqgE/AlgH family protein [Deltaproteobacteria bacterium]|nr:YqgE/AlgH family protein [Deltaproteobacteria bacterium]
MGQPEFGRVQAQAPGGVGGGAVASIARERVPDIVPGEGIIGAGERLRVTSSRAAFDALAREVKEGRPADRRCLVLLGYSGWASQQLEAEIARGAWLPGPLDERLLFEVAAEERWEQAYALLGLTPFVGMSMRSVGQA